MKQDRINQQQYARMLYVYEGREIAEIAETLGLARSTVYAWAQNEDWKAEREGKTISPAALAAEFKRSMLVILNRAREEKRALDGKESDALAKLSKARESVMRESNYMGIAFDVLDKFQRFLRDHSPELLTVPLNNAIGDFLKQTLSRL